MSWNSEDEMFETTVREDHDRSLERVRQHASQDRIMGAIRGERDHQDRKWGVQRHPDGTSDDCESRLRREYAIALADAKAGNETLTWWDILREEVAEAGAEVDAAALRAELVQVAAVCVAWVEDIDARG